MEIERKERERKETGKKEISFLCFDVKGNMGG